MTVDAQLEHEIRRDAGTAAFGAGAYVIVAAGLIGAACSKASRADVAL
jgi:hypothetical protein